MVKLYLKNDAVLTINFQRPKNYDSEIFKLILIGYTKKGLMSFQTLISSFRLNYQEVQELKQQYFSTDSE